MLILTEGEGDAPYLEVIDAGAKGSLEIPCAVPEICRTIDKFCSPRQLRGAQRYSIPQTSLRLQQADCDLNGRVVNISEGGLLCQLEAFAGFDWMQSALLDLSFAHLEESVNITGVCGVPVNINVMRSNPDDSPAQIRVAFRFVGVIPEARQQLCELFANIDLEQQLAELTD